MTFFSFSFSHHTYPSSLTGDEYFFHHQQLLHYFPPGAVRSFAWTCPGAPRSPPSRWSSPWRRCTWCGTGGRRCCWPLPPPPPWPPQSCSSSGRSGAVWSHLFHHLLLPLHFQCLGRANRRPQHETLAPTWRRAGRRSGGALDRSESGWRLPAKEKMKKRIISG